MTETKKRSEPADRLSVGRKAGQTTITLTGPAPANGVLQLHVQTPVPELSAVAALTVAPVRSGAQETLRLDEAFQRLTRARAEADAAQVHQDDLALRLKSLQIQRREVERSAPEGLAAKLRQLDADTTPLQATLSEASRNIAVLKPVVVSLARAAEQKIETVVCAEMTRVEADLRAQRAALLEQLGDVAGDLFGQLALVEMALVQVGGRLKVQTRETLRAELAAWKSETPEQKAADVQAAGIGTALQ